MFEVVKYRHTSVNVSRYVLAYKDQSAVVCRCAWSTKVQWLQVVAQQGGQEWCLFQRRRCNIRNTVHVLILRVRHLPWPSWT